MTPRSNMAPKRKERGSSPSSPQTKPPRKQRVRRPSLGALGDPAGDYSSSPSILSRNNPKETAKPKRHSLGAPKPRPIPIPIPSQKPSTSKTTPESLTEHSPDAIMVIDKPKPRPIPIPTPSQMPSTSKTTLDLTTENTPDTSMNIDKPPTPSKAPMKQKQTQESSDESNDESSDETPMDVETSLVKIEELKPDADEFYVDTFAARPSFWSRPPNEGTSSGRRLPGGHTKAVEGPEIYFNEPSVVWYRYYERLCKDKDVGKLAAAKRIKSELIGEFHVWAAYSMSTFGKRGGIIIGQTVGSILQTRSPHVRRIPDQETWAVVECTSQEQHDKLLETKIIYNTTEKVYVTFRKPSVSSNAYRVLEPVGMRSKEDWDTLKKRLKDDGVQTILRDPESFIQDRKDRYTWILSFPTPNYLPPRIDCVNPRRTLFIRPSILCTTCNGQGHHFTLCAYKERIWRTASSKPIGKSWEAFDREQDASRTVGSGAEISIITEPDT